MACSLDSAHKLSLIAVRRLEGDDAHGAAGPTDDLQGRGDNDGAGRGQKIEIHQAGQAELAVAMHDKMIGERRLEPRRLPGVSADRLDADSKNVALLGEEERRGFVQSGRVRTVLVDVEILGGRLPLRPARAQENPAAGRDPSILALPPFDERHIDQEIRIRRRFRTDIQDARGANE